ncbi:hypothetical protein NEOLEDRAFT_1142260 [Neolentinus lepideus HHB14362 ss-1]|uniref:Uncharacterized protein n=1 Tax=Neolentinus lepideus HHB14362 ss-1 TaxID=1314782 RepID=A0A165N976_9AGAM|nr:hypothetical protein NEOLEDRAFT_1142260 [Neolentinus lepideus HHB14362 ss-1]
MFLYEGYLAVAVNLCFLGAVERLGWGSGLNTCAACRALLWTCHYVIIGSLCAQSYLRDLERAILAGRILYSRPRSGPSIDSEMNHAIKRLSLGCFSRLSPSMSRP